MYNFCRNSMLLVGVNAYLSVMGWRGTEERSQEV